MNSIKWTAKAFKQLRKLDHQVQKVIRDSVVTLEAMPNCHNVKSLTNHEYDYRLRVGNYRVLFNWDGEIKVVEIEEVKKRDERTY
ncbi:MULTISPECIES: type II toxin-antitoxin system RelE family toxin [Burkholderia]|uniref:type II toxin-antitoxin system RelE family toxin n=1 Tax=Burkholderia TaxID=32008 RepID=UPI000756E46C|nr:MULTISPECIES: type II toxin-antitoxin system RelE/ParE family toxin [Burkholderia]KVH68835.1 cytotoxic translational repressor of toxin-antitoxin stability system [Burkholderia cepacia]KVS58044.1 cytotoxic translational repressor of toxin-antitoxin stability system [Burkholderia cepacia]KWC59023.1 cytotoxic translational repressor of toxin-antitoxin stability system [Burkholderia cepacia]KWD57255.1 cytotoxic translational repressor of toxin-antitoxin stability system [Burkholderia cepacia]K